MFGIICAICMPYKIYFTHMHIMHNAAPIPLIVEYAL